MPITKDWEALTGAMESGVKSLLNDLIDGAITDLDGPIRAAGQRLTIATKRGRKDLVMEVRDQLALIVLEKKLRMSTGGKELFELMLGMGLNALVNGAIGGLASLKSA